MKLQGVDLSSIQQKVDYGALAKTVAFGYVKEGEGIRTVDGMGLAHANGLKAAGVPVGYYYYAHDEDTPQASAAAFKAVLAGRPAPDLLYAVDIEANAPKLSPEDLEQWLEDFIAELGLPVIIYSGPGFINANLPATHKLGRFPLWLAEYNNKPEPTLMPNGWTACTVWQYTGTGTITGTDGHPMWVDLDTAEELPLLPGLQSV